MYYSVAIYTISICTVATLDVSHHCKRRKAGIIVGVKVKRSQFKNNTKVTNVSKVTRAL
jgi:hypothetical protein